MEQCVGTHTVWSSVLGPIQYGAVCVGTHTVWSDVLGPIQYGAVCWDPYREDQVNTLNGVQKKAAKFSNNINESSWETLAQRRLIARICAIFKANTGGPVWKATGDRLLKPCYLSRDDHNRKIRTRKQRTDVCKYSFINRTIRSWNQLPASLLASFPRKLNTVQCLDHPPYSLDLVPSDYHLFLRLKKQLKRCHFLSEYNKMVTNKVSTFLIQTYKI
jgi:hypothetical protein